MIRRSVSYLPLLAWLILVWVLLWGSLSPAVLASALVIAPLALVACRLPPVAYRAHPRWHRLPVELARFIGEVVTSSAQVAWATLRRGPRTRSAVVAVPVRCPSDVALTLVAHRLSLVPGTLTIDMDRDEGVLYVYVFDVYTTAEADRAGRRADHDTAKLLRALGFGTARSRREERGLP